MGKSNVVTGGRKRKEAKAPVNQLRQSDSEDDDPTTPSNIVRKTNGKLRIKKKDLKRLQKQKNVLKTKSVGMSDVHMMTDSELVAKIMPTEVKLGKTLSKRLEKMKAKKGISLAKRMSVKGTLLASMKNDPCKTKTIEGRPMSKKKIKKLAKRDNYAKLEKAAALSKVMLANDLVMQVDKK